MGKFRYTPGSIARCSDELQDREDVLGFFSRAVVVLNDFGITLVDGIVVVTTDYPGSLAMLAGMSYTVSGACALLELAAQGLVVVSENARNSNVIEYYLKYQHNREDDTAFDYHGSYVQTVVDALIEVELEYTREALLYRERGG